MKYLLDSNVWIEVLKGRNLILTDRFTATPFSRMASCSTVRSELMHGAEKYSDDGRRSAKVERLLEHVVSLPFDDACADIFAKIRHSLELRRCIIGPYDLQIAAVALVHDLIVVTGNINEFSRVHGLKVEDWSDASSQSLNA